MRCMNIKIPALAVLLVCSANFFRDAVSAEKKTVVGVSLLTMTNPFFRDLGDAMKDEAAKHRMEVLLTAGEFDAAKQRNQVADFIVRRVDAIVLAPCDSKAVGTAISEANKAGIPVFTADIAVLAPGVKVESHIATDNLGGGRLAAQGMIEALGGRGKVAIIEHPEVESAMLRTKGFEEELARQKKEQGMAIDIVAKLPGGGVKDKSFKAAEDLMQAHPDVNGIFASNDPSAVGAVAALEKAGKLGQVKIIGFDGMPEGKQAIKEGKIYADPIQFPDRIGRQTIQTIVKYLAGDEVPKETLIPTALYRKADALKDPVLRLNQNLPTNRNVPGLLTNAQREFLVQKRYLNLPVKNGAAKRRVSFIAEERTEREFEIELANAEPNFWAFLDLAPFQGKRAMLKVDLLPQDSKALESIEQADRIKGAENLYQERLRPQFHFSSRRGWNNDPNGLVYDRGEYHLFYQHNPYGWNWGNMHWGHAVSADLVHWQELPIAIYPREFGDWVFSGSAVVDKENTAGWKTGKEAVLVAAFTSTGRGECISYSNDRGRSWQEFSGNPVVKHRGRDPKLVWHAPTHKWVMCLYDEVGATRNIAFYTSPDLKSWEFQSRIEGFFECPDLFELPVDATGSSADGSDAAKKTKWVLTAASSEYRIGQFDGKQFTPETPRLPGQRGRGFYAAQTYSDIPPSDGRRIQVGWGQMPAPGMPFNQMMTFPCELTLRTTPDGIRLCFQPVREIEKLHGKSHRLKAQPLNPGENPLSSISGELFDIRAEFEPGEAAQIGFNIRGSEVTFDVQKQELLCKDRKMPLRVADGKVRLQILADRTSLEIFGNDGIDYMPMPVIAKEDDKSLALFAKGGAAKISALEVFELRSAWEEGRRGVGAWER